MQITKFYYKILKRESRTLGNLKKNIKFLFRTSLYFTFQKDLIIFTMNHKYLSKKSDFHECLLCKLHRPYLCNFFKSSEKLKAIKDNYSFIDESFPFRFNEKLYNSGSIKLAEIFGKNGEKYYINLLTYIEYPKEGELSIRVTDEENLVLSTLTFSFIKYKKTGYKVFIGGIQGVKKEIDHNNIKKATKALYGLFPKKLAVESLYIFLKLSKIDIDKICVGNKQHAFYSLRYFTNIKISANYDDFWKSLDGELWDSNLWKLPNEIKKKNTEDIESKKRGLYRKRYKLLEELEIEMEKNLSLLKN